MTITADSDLTQNRTFWVVTTAALPWRTGTAVNPFLRALKLLEYTDKTVTLVVPWISSAEERVQIYGNQYSFNSREDQELWLRDWAKLKCNSSDEVLSSRFRICFYDATYQGQLGSVIPLVDICSLIPEDEADVAILEEPEHLNWLPMPISTSLSHQGEITNNNKRNVKAWTEKFRFVVGIIHTNYNAYAETYAPLKSGILAKPTIGALSKLVVRAYCHKIIKLSETLPSYASWKEVTSNVHGVRDEFLTGNGDVNDTTTESKMDDQVEETTTASAMARLFRSSLSSGLYYFSPHSSIQSDEDETIEEEEEKVRSPIYFIGKLTWAKGFDITIHLEHKYKEVTGGYFPIDVYGSGPDEEEIKSAFSGGEDNYDNSSITKTARVERISSGYTKVAQIVFESSESLRSLIDNNKDVTVEDKEGGDKEQENHELESSSHISRDISFDKLSVIPEIAGLAKNTAAATSKAIFQLSKTAVSSAYGMINNNKSPVLKVKLPVEFLGVIDHAELKNKYKIFLNPSVSEVLCTTTAEALAMGKFVIIPSHPSNYFFDQFTNCLIYESEEQFIEHLQYALKNDPEPLTSLERRKFTWEAATERLIEAAGITEEDYEKEYMSPGRVNQDKRLLKFHKESRFLLRKEIVHTLVGKGKLNFG